MWVGVDSKDSKDSFLFEIFVRFLSSWLGVAGCEKIWLGVAGCGWWWLGVGGCG